jgi:hypothetical protein
VLKKNVRDINIIKVATFLKKLSLKNYFDEKLFKIASFLEYF